METLQQIWQRLKEQGYETDKGSVHSYIPVYEKLLAPYRETALNVLEIGLFNGNSMRMWREYFTNATIHGIDCSVTPHDGMADLRPLIAEIDEEYIPKMQIHIFDAENQKEVENRFKGVKFDVIIEDANHSLQQQVILAAIWHEYVKEGGVYIIEDVQDIKNIVSIANGEIIDLRHVKNRYDDVLIVLK